MYKYFTSQLISYWYFLRLGYQIDLCIRWKNYHLSCSLPFRVTHINAFFFPFLLFLYNLKFFVTSPSHFPFWISNTVHVARVRVDISCENSIRFFKIRQSLEVDEQFQEPFIDLKEFLWWVYQFPSLPLPPWKSTDRKSPEAWVCWKRACSLMAMNILV